MGKAGIKVMGKCRGLAFRENILIFVCRWREVGGWQEDVAGPRWAEREGGIPPSGAEV